MLTSTSKLIKDCLTSKDGESYDVARLGIFVGLVMLCGSVIYGLFAAEKIILTDLGSLLQSFGISLGALLGGGGAGIGMKSKSEPE